MLESPFKSGEAALLSGLIPGFLAYAQIELGFAAQSIDKYRECLGHIMRAVGDREVQSYSEEDVFLLKSDMLRKGHGACRQVSLLATFKRILLYCRSRLNLEVLDPDLIRMPKRPRREVMFLTPEEVDRFVRSIPLTTLEDRPSIAGVRFRALVETILGTAMRIGEVLSLDRSAIDFAVQEARIVGKGNKQRTVFFTTRALQWLNRYLEIRTDEHPALFVTLDGRSRLGRPDIWRPFDRYRKTAGINKPVTPHLLRHTAATQLLFNGCPVGHIKEILGHERLETTCRYYLGLDRRAAKIAHQQFLVYGPANDEVVG